MRCAMCDVHCLCLLVNVLFSVRLPLFLSHEPGATGECWECKPPMSDGDSSPGKQSNGKEMEAGREMPCIILYQPQISTVTPQEKDIRLWMIVHFNSLINQL